MAALIQFVDSIAADPVVRLDLNDAQSWFCTNFKAPPPRLRRSESENSMRDGGVVGSSSYGNRTLELDLTLIEDGEEEWAAEEMQKLWRELDRATNILRYWPEGLDKPVFFRTFRSDVSELEELWTTPIARNISLELLAEPFALGQREALAYTINNDPAAASNAMTFTIPAGSALGDVPAPLLVSTAVGSTAKGILFASGAPGIIQGEACDLSNDTTNPGGGPDAAMSGTGTNNYVTTSFATNAAMVERLATPGTVYGVKRVVAIVRRSDNTSVLKARAAVGVFDTYGETVTIPQTTNRQAVDLGVIQVGPATEVLDYSFTATGSSTDLEIQASRTSGSGSLQWDALILLPADTQCLAAQFTTARYVTIDSATEMVAGSAGILLTGSAISQKAQVAGGFPVVRPGVANTYSWVHQTANLEPHLKTAGINVTVWYHPQYLFVRPVSS